MRSPSQAPACLLLVITLVACGQAKKKWKELTSECSPDGSASCEGTTLLRCVDGHRVVSTVCGGAEGCREGKESVRCDQSKGEVGDACDTERAWSCAHDGKSVSICTSGKRELEGTCDGPKGCTIEGDSASCDGLHARVGAPCTGEGAACRQDGKAQLDCKAGVFAVARECLGAKGCKHVGDEVSCDTSIATEGTSCTTGTACSVDRKKRLSCKSGAFVIDSTCSGPGGCVPADDGVTCHRPRAAVGGPCGEGIFSCNETGKSMLLCKAGSYARTEECKGSKGCDDAGDNLLCDGSYAEVGWPCDSGGSCTADGKALLSCEGGSYAVRAHCRGARGCFYANDSVQCEGAD